MIKINASTVLNVLVFAVLAFVVLTKAPELYRQYKLKQSPLPAFLATELDGRVFNSAQLSKKTILVFWATWCGPCTLELSRLNDLVKDQVISSDQVLAISIGEPSETVLKAVRERGYLFQVVTDEPGLAASVLGVQGTPTVVFVDDYKKINWMTTGLSPLLSLRARLFLN